MSLLEIEHPYETHGAASELMSCNAPEVLLDGPAGTGKSRAALHKIASLCEAYPKTRALICRETRVSCTESILVTLERDVIWGYPWDLGRGITRGGRDEYRCANGSVIVVGGLDSPEKLFSTEWDLVYVAEAIEITVDAWEKFARAMRNRAIPRGVGGGPQQSVEERATQPHPQTGEPVPAFWTQRIADCNPGAPGHWLNQRAINGKMTRLLSRHQDNPSLTKDFLEGLRNLTGHRRARLFEGRWVGAEGGVFPEFQEDKHVVKPFKIPSDWLIVMLYDGGYDHPCAILWAAIAPTGTIYIIGEIHEREMALASAAAKVRQKESEMDWIVRSRWADPQGSFAKRQESPKSAAMQWRDLGFRLSPWLRTGMGQHSRVEALRKRFIDDTLKIFECCKMTIFELQSWRYKRTAQGDIPQGDDAYEDRNNDSIDCLLGLVALPLKPLPL